MNIRSIFLRPFVPVALLVMLSGFSINGFAQTAMFSGTWNNTTFSSSGAARFTIQFQADQASFTFDLDGSVFGQSNPAPVTLPGTIGPGSIVFSKNGDSFYGDMTIEIGFDGSMSIVFDNIPAAGIDRMEASGQLDDSSNQQMVNYTVFFTGSGTAVGTITTTLQSGNLPKLTLLAQVGGGDGTLSSDIVMTNPTGSTVTGVVTFAGGDGSAALFNLAAFQGNPAGMAGSVPFTIPALSSATLSILSTGTLGEGSAAILSSDSIGAVARFNLVGAGIAGVGTGTPVSSFIIPVRREEMGINTGVAIRNVSNKSVDPTLTLRSGDQVVATVPLETPIPANGHVAKFISELFPKVDTRHFTGTLVVEVQDGLLTATALELDQTQPGVFTTLPVTPLKN